MTAQSARAEGVDADAAGGRYLVGIDLGGSGGRCLVLDVETGTTTVATRAWTHRPAPAYGHWALDLDVDLTWRVVGETCREALRRAGAPPNEVAGVAVTAMRHGLVVVDGDGVAVFAVPTMDARAGMLALQVRNERGAELYQRTGRWPLPILGAVRLMWLAQTLPATLERATAALSMSDWLGYRLTGTAVAARSQAAEMLALDLAAGAWADDLVASYGLPRSIFPPLADAGTVIGGVTEAAATHLGLRAGTPVVVAGADTQCALVAAGAVATGQLGIIAGTTTSVMQVTPQPVVDPERRLWAGPHVVPGLHVLESNAGSTGQTLDWLAAIWYPGVPSPVAALCAEAGHAAPGAGGIASTVGAQVFDAPGLDLPVDGLSFSAISMMRSGEGREALARAVLEGMAYALRANVEQEQRLAGPAAAPVRLAGGMTRSAVWTAIVAGALGRPVDVARPPEASAHGAAICAGVGAGLYADVAAGASGLAAVERSHTPEPSTVALYGDGYTRWLAQRDERAGADTLVAEAIVQAVLEQPGEAAPAPPAGFRPRIYVSAELDDAALEALRTLGEVTYASYRRESRLLVGEDLWEALAGVHVFVTEVDVVDAEALAKLPDLRLIVACRGNPVNVDVAACTAAGVPVIHTPGRNADAVADLTVAFMLMLARKLPEATAFLRLPGGEPGDMGRMGMAHEQFQGAELWRKSVGLVGAGAVGRRVIGRLLPFGARVLVSDPGLSPEEVALLGAEKVDLAQLLGESDFVSLHAPVTDATRGIINDAALAQMKHGAFLINTARAALVDDEALIGALRSGKLGGVALDVFAVEPPGAGDPLLALPNVIATPHIGGNTRDVAAHQGALVVAALQQLLAGERPPHAANPETLAGFAWTGPRHVDQAALRQLAAGPGPAVTDLEAGLQADSQPPPAGERGGLLGRLGRAFRKPSPVAPAPEPSRVPTPSPTPTPGGSETLETLQRILERFTAAVAADAGMAAFARGKDVTMRFTLRDVEQDFYLSFVDGHVAAALGAPPHEPNVSLKMNAAILDGVFMGSINGMRAAMTGKLSFSGDTNKAMAFQRLQGDLGRLYRAAREAVGDPGDLTQLVPAAAGSAAPGATPATGAAEGGASAAPSAPPITTLGDVRDDVIAVMQELYSAHLISPTGGNVSVRVDGDPDHVWITPSAVFKGDLRPEMLVQIDLAGRVVSDNGYSASSERHVHCAIYRARPEVQAVIHSHAPQATLMALAGIPFLPISPEAAFLGDVPVVPYMRPGSPELAEAVAAALGPKGSAVLMQNHGLVVAASSLRRAADLTYIVEATASKLVTCRLLGVNPALLPADEVAEMRALGEMIA